MRTDHRAFTLLDKKGGEAAWLTFGGLDRGARAVAARLQDLGASGERAVLAFPPGLDFIVAFLGCFYARVAAIPAYLPTLHRGVSRFLAILEDSEPPVIVGLEDGLDRLQEQLAEQWPEAIRRLSVDDASPQDADAWRAQNPEPEDLAFLQYTSGSTSTPKGVMVSHGNLLHNLSYIQRIECNGRDAVGCSWLPSFHDMGLIEGLLEPIYAGYPTYLMSPLSFLQRPALWLQTISRVRATNSGGPNFAFDLCTQRIRPEELRDADLSCWKFAYNGAEPVRAATLRAFHERFAPYGFRWRSARPVFGLAEGTLVASGDVRGREPVILEVCADELERGRIAEPAEDGRSRPLVGSGAVQGGMDVAIVDPEAGLRCGAGTIGEIWLTGPSVARGYWRRPELSEATFRAQLGGDDRQWLRTGDLGIVVDDQLFVTGRLSDMIIIAGRNQYPQDIELTVETAHEALRTACSVAFGVDVDGEERLGVAAEVEPRLLHRPSSGGAPVEIGQVAKAVRRAVAAEHQLQVHHLALLRKGEVPKTTSGKVRRRACGQMLRGGELRTLLDECQGRKGLDRGSAEAPSTDEVPQRKESARCQ